MALEIDLVNTYFPKLSELTEAQLLSARTRAQSVIREVYPDVDMRPGSPLGDTVLSPFAMLIAMLEVATQRFASDLDLENVAAGTIYNCAFVEKFLNNFAVFPQLSLRSTGVIRLVFNENKTYEIDRRFQFSTGENAPFTLRLPHEGLLTLLPVGSTKTPQLNQIVLNDLGNNTYGAEIAVEGDVDSSVAAADTFTTNIVIPELITAYSVVNFDTGNPGSSLKMLAEKTRQTFPAASLTSKTCARSFLLKEFPDLFAASAITNNDHLMLRSDANALGFIPGRVDLFVRSKQYDTVYEQVIKIKYNTELKKYVSKLNLISPAYYIDSLTTNDINGDTLTLRPGEAVPGRPTYNNVYRPVDIYSKSNNAAKAPLLTCAGTSYEDLWVVFDMPIDLDNNDSELLTTYDENGERYTSFTIRYYTDPLFKFIEERLSSTEVKPAGVDILVRPFVPMLLSQFNVQYSKQAGVSLTIENARNEIYNYLRQVSYPKAYSNARISDSMFYAGADDVTAINITANPLWSAANKILPADVDSPEDDLAAAFAGALNVPDIGVTNIDATNNLQVLAHNDFVELSTKAAIGVSNLSFLIPSAQTITFSEVLR